MIQENVGSNEQSMLYTPHEIAWFVVHFPLQKTSKKPSVLTWSKFCMWCNVYMLLTLYVLDLFFENSKKEDGKIENVGNLMQSLVYFYVVMK